MKHDSQRSDGGVREPGAAASRFWLVIILLVVWSAAFVGIFAAWVRVAMAADLHSHVLLIPAVSVYLLVTGRQSMSMSGDGSPGLGLPLVVLGALAAWAGFRFSEGWSEVDRVALGIASYVVGVWGITVSVCGMRWMRAAAFPMWFLIFMIPLPGAVEAALEQGLMVPSAWVSQWAFELGRIPVHRDGQVLELPGIVLVVAEECSGIRSTLVLFITSILAAYLFLPTLPRRLILVAVVLPLGILRNALRIFVIGWLCVEYGPEMIDHWLHRSGGPLFFGASLVPLLAVAWLLRRGGRGKPASERGEDATLHPKRAV